MKPWPWSWHSDLPFLSRRRQKRPEGPFHLSLTPTKLADGFGWRSPYQHGCWTHPAKLGPPFPTIHRNSALFIVNDEHSTLCIGKLKTKIMPRIRLHQLNPKEFRSQLSISWFLKRISGLACLISNLTQKSGCDSRKGIATGLYFAPVSGLGAYFRPHFNVPSLSRND